MRVHLGRTGGLWHQSIKVTAKMTPCHSWRALSPDECQQLLVSVEGFCSRRVGLPPSFVPPPKHGAFWQTAPQERERNEIWQIVPNLSKSVSEPSSFAPNQDPNPNLLLLFPLLLCVSRPRSSQLLRRGERRAFHEAAWVGACICFSVGACIISRFPALYQYILCLWICPIFLIFSQREDEY